MDPEVEIRRLAAELTELAHRHGTPLFEISRDLGRHPNYLSRALAGSIELKVDDTFSMLLDLGLVPRELFTWMYPMGGVRGPEPAAGSKEAKELAEAAEARRRYDEEQGRHLLSAADWTREVRALLRDLLRRKKISQPKASRALGLGPKALPAVLAGGTRLGWAHLFGVLALTDTKPWRFFLELFSPPEGDAFAQLRRVRYLDALEQRLNVSLSEEELRGGPEPDRPAKL